MISYTTKGCFVKCSGIRTINRRGLRIMVWCRPLRVRAYTRVFQKLGDIILDSRLGVYFSY